MEVQCLAEMRHLAGFPRAQGLGLRIVQCYSCNTQERKHFYQIGQNAIRAPDRGIIEQTYVLPIPGSDSRPLATAPS